MKFFEWINLINPIKKLRSVKRQWVFFTCGEADRS